MHTQNSSGLPDMETVVRLLRKFGKKLMSDCPSSESLVFAVDEPELLDDETRQIIIEHIMICRDCCTKVEWLRGEDATLVEDKVFATTLSFPVRIPDFIRPDNTAFAASSTADSDASLLVPYIKSDQGDLFGEIGQDLEGRIFLEFERIPEALQGHLVQVTAETRDGNLIICDKKSISGPIVNLVAQTDLRPTDIIKIGLHFGPLLPS